MASRSRVRRVITEAEAQLSSDRAGDPLAHLKGLSWPEFARRTHIRSGDRVVSFEPYPYQIDIVNCLEERSLLAVKSRQLGISETLISWAIWRAVRNPAWLGVVISRTGEDSRQLAARAREQLQSLGISRSTDNLLDLRLEGGGGLIFRAPTADSARGLASVSALIIDEASVINNLETLYTSAMPATSAVGDRARVAMVGTPQSPSGFFYDLLNKDKEIELLCDEIRHGNRQPAHFDTVSNWNRAIIHWSAHPIYSQYEDFLGYVKEKFNLSDAGVATEYDLSFHETTVSVFSPDLVRGAVVKSEEIPESFDSCVLGIDPAFGGGDFCVGLVLGISGGKVYIADTYRKRKSTNELNIYYLADLIDRWNPDDVGVEVNSGGAIYFENLSSQFWNVKFHQIRTTSDSKPSLINRITIALERGILKVPESHPLVNELLSFRRYETGNSVSLAAAEGSHDDAVMALSFGLEMAKFEIMGGFRR